MSEAITLRPLPRALDEEKVVNHLSTVVAALWSVRLGFFILDRRIVAVLSNDG